MIDRFRQRRSGMQPGPDRYAIQGLSTFAAVQGWSERPDDHDGLGGSVAFPMNIRERVYDIVHTHSDPDLRDQQRLPRFEDGYEGTYSGHRFIVANAWTVDADIPATAIAAMQVSDRFVLPFLSVVPLDPQPLPPTVTETGSPFDRTFRIVAMPVTAARLLTTPARDRIAAHQGWRLWTLATSLIVVSSEPFCSVAEITETLGDVAAVADEMLSDLAAMAESWPLAFVPSIDGQLPGIPESIRPKREMFNGRIDAEDLNRQIASLPPDEQETAMAVLHARQGHQT